MYFVLIFVLLNIVSGAEYTETINVQDYLSSLGSRNLPKLPDLEKERYPNLFQPDLVSLTQLPQDVPNNFGRSPNDKIHIQIKPEHRVEFQVTPQYDNVISNHDMIDIKITPDVYNSGNLVKSVPLGKNDGSEFQLIRKAVPRSGNLHLSPPLSKTEDLPNRSHLTLPRPEMAPYPNLNKIQDKPIPLLPKDILKVPPPPFVKDVGYVPPATVKPLPSYVDYAKWDLFKKPDLKAIADKSKTSKYKAPTLADLGNLFNFADFADNPKFTKFPALSDLGKAFKLPDLSKLVLPNFSQLPLPDFTQLNKLFPPLPDVPVTKLQPIQPLTDDYKISLPPLPDLTKLPTLPLPDLSGFSSGRKGASHGRAKRSSLEDESKSQSIPGMELLFKALKVPNLSGWAIPNIAKLKDLQIAKIPDLDMAEFIHSQGYPVELHEIVTEDGYILGTYRIPHGRHSTTNLPNPYPVMVNHGIMGSAENFIVGGPEKALPFVLADHGFDVWLMNARGSRHSRKHQHLNPDKDPKFWKFTFHEIGYYDLPATIDYILHVTLQPKLHYIGHSQGSTVFFVMASERPEYNAKVKLSISLAPSVILKNIPDPTAQWGAPLYPQLLKMVESTKFYETNPPQVLSNQAMRSILRSICGEKGDPSICLNMFKTMSYGIGDQIDPKTIPLITATVLGGASAYQSVHFAQVVATGKFAQMDWGEEENMKRYHQKYPPAYNLNNVVCPVSLMYAKGDSLIAIKDVMTLAHLLPNVVDLYKVPYDNWTHMDFVWAKSVDKYLNPHIFDMLHKYLE